MPEGLVWLTNENVWAGIADWDFVNAVNLNDEKKKSA